MTPWRPTQPGIGQEELARGRGTSSRAPVEARVHHPRQQVCIRVVSIDHVLGLTTTSVSECKLHGYFDIMPAVAGAVAVAVDMGGFLSGCCVASDLSTRFTSCD